MNLMEKLFEIQKACTYVQKAAQGYQYKYAAGTDVLVPIRAKMDELGVMLIPEVRNGRAERGESVDDRGKPKIQFLTQADMEFIWVDVANPTDRLPVPWYGQGVDPAEKGVGKFLTYAERYFLLKFFHIPTDNDDPDRFQERRVEAGKRVKKTGAIPPPPPAYHEPVKQLNNGNPTPDNPWRGLLVSISNPTTGKTDAGREWMRWEIDAGDMTLYTFDKGIAEVAANAIQDGLMVEMVWRLKKSAKTGAELLTAESMRLLEGSEMDRDFARYAGN